MKIDEILKNLDIYIPVGDIDDFPIEIVKKMVERQVEQGNPPNVTVFEEYRNNGRLKRGFDWEMTPERKGFWNNVINDRKFDVFFEKYPKDVKESQPEAELPPKKVDTKYNPEFKVGDPVFDIIRGIKDVVITISGSYDYPVATRHYAYTSYGKGKINDKNPILLHYRDDYNYDVIDFNNLPKRQENEKELYIPEKYRYEGYRDYK